MWHPYKPKISSTPYDKWNEKLSADEEHLRLCEIRLNARLEFYLPEMLCKQEAYLEVLCYSYCGIRADFFNVLFDAEKLDMNKEVVSSFIEKVKSAKNQEILNGFLELRKAENSFRSLLLDGPSTIEER
jgi:hypothetical protein